MQLEDWVFHDYVLFFQVQENFFSSTDIVLKGIIRRILLKSYVSGDIVVSKSGFTAFPLFFEGVAVGETFIYFFQLPLFKVTAPGLILGVLGRCTDS